MDAFPVLVQLYSAAEAETARDEADERVARLTETHGVAQGELNRLQKATQDLEACKESLAASLEEVKGTLSTREAEVSSLKFELSNEVRDGLDSGSIQQELYAVM